LAHYKEVGKEIFHQSINSTKWSSEEIYRHLLMGMHWIGLTLIGDNYPSHPLALRTGGRVENTSSFEEVSLALNEVSDEIRKSMKNFSLEKLNEQVTTYYGDIVKFESQIVSILHHEVEHLGELKLIFKRLTGWTDDQMYKLTSTK